MQIHRQHAVGAGRAEHVGDELGRNRHARLVFAILPRVAVIRHHRRDARRRRSAERIDHDHQLHQVLIDRPGRRRAGRLHDEDIRAADVLVDLKRDFGVRKTPEPGLSDRDAQKRRDLLRQLAVRAAREHFQLAETGRHQRFTSHRQPFRREVGWGGRIRTFEYGIQSPAPYRLATPHRDDSGRLSELEIRTSGVAEPPSANRECIRWAAIAASLGGIYRCEPPGAVSSARWQPGDGR